MPTATPHPAWVLAAQLCGIAPDTADEVEKGQIEAALADLKAAFATRMPIIPTAEDIKEIAREEAEHVMPVIPERGLVDRWAGTFAVLGLILGLAGTIGAAAVAWKSTMDERELWLRVATESYATQYQLPGRIAAVEGAIATLQAAQPTPAPAAPPPPATTTDPAAPAQPTAAAMDDANISAKCNNIVALGGTDGYRLDQCADSQTYVCRAYDQPRGQVSECALASTVP